MRPNGLNTYAAYHVMRGGVDPSGKDFIAVGDRPVGEDFLGNPFFHYSLEYWKCSCLLEDFDEDKEYKPSEIKDICENAPDKWNEAVELLAERGWNGLCCNPLFSKRQRRERHLQIASYSPADELDRQAECRSASGLEGLQQSRWNAYYYRWGYEFFGRGAVAVPEVYNNAAVSVVYTNSDATRIVPIFSDPDPDVVKAKWDLIMKNAKRYAFAEWNGDISNKPFRGPFRRWPRSHYASFGTNSNTFVKEMVRKAGLRMPNMGGLHPGDDRPSINHPPALMNALFFDATDPWRNNAPPPPAPQTIDI